MAIYTGPNTYRSKDASMHDNASMYDNASMHDNASMWGDARMWGNSMLINTTLYANAVIKGDGIIESLRDYIVIGPAISSGRFTTAHRDSVIGVRINTGCFSGSLEEFIAAINETHADNPPAHAQYMAFVALIRAQFVDLLSS